VRPEEIDASNRYYRKSLETHTNEARIVDWGSPESQRARFDVLVQVGPLEGASALDVGCGLGALAGYLRERGLNVDYTGLDLSEAMTAEAVRRRPFATFVTGEVLTWRPEARFDYVLSSGIFNRTLEDNAGYIRETLRRMVELARCAVAVNFLSTYADRRYIGPESYLSSPEEIFTLARSLVKRVTLRHDYLEHDFTVFLYKEPGC